jgi:hypothetical protein
MARPESSDEKKKNDELKKETPAPPAPKGSTPAGDEAGFDFGNPDGPSNKS